MRFLGLAQNEPARQVAHSPPLLAVTELDDTLDYTGQELELLGPMERIANQPSPAGGVTPTRARARTGGPEPSPSRQLQAPQPLADVVALNAEPEAETPHAETAGAVTPHAETPHAETADAVTPAAVPAAAPRVVAAAAAEQLPPAPASETKPLDGKGPLRNLGDTATWAAEQRVERHLQQALLERDRLRGTGSNWLSSALIQAAMGVAPLRSTARLAVITDAQGLVVHIEVLSSDAQREQWDAVAKRALTQLSTQRSASPYGRATRTVLELGSKVQLPSGRSPGMGVTVLNLPLKERRYKDSPNIEILSLKPKLEQVEVLDPTSSGGGTLKVPVIQLQLGVLSINGDLVDIGSVGRHVVHARVVREELL